MSDAGKSIEQLNAEIELLTACKARLQSDERARVDAIEKRRASYEAIARRVLNKARVEFSDKITDGFGGPPGSADGEVIQEDGVYVIRIAPGLSLEREHSVFVHELIHSVIHFPPDLSAPERKEVQLIREAYMSEEFREASGIDGRREMETAYEKRERECDDVAEMVFPYFYPGERYTPHG